MSRKPVTEYIGGKGPRQRIWEAIRRLKAAGNEAFTEDDIWRAVERAEVDIEMGAIRDYRRALVKAEILAEVTAPQDRRVPGTYRLVVDEGIEAPRLRKDGSRVTQGLPQEQMWRTLRMLTHDIDAREMAAHASTPKHQVTEVAAHEYMDMLERAGYLECTRKGHGGGVKARRSRYRLKPLRNTGPRPPMICRVSVVFDPNENRVVWAKSVTDEDAIYAR